MIRRMNVFGIDPAVDFPHKAGHVGDSVALGQGAVRDEAES